MLEVGGMVAWKVNYVMFANDTDLMTGLSETPEAGGRVWVSM